MSFWAESWSEDPLPAWTWRPELSFVFLSFIEEALVVDLGMSARKNWGWMREKN